jgi:hypothetical protein
MPTWSIQNHKYLVDYTYNGINVITQGVEKTRVEEETMDQRPIYKAPLKSLAFDII